MNKYLILKWTNSCSINDILFEIINPYTMYIDGDVEKPKYETEEEGAQDGDGEFIPTTQKVTKLYNLEIGPIIESQVDALHVMSICDSVSLLDKNFDEFVIKQGSVQLTAEWLNEKYAIVQMSFQINDTLTRNNCC